MKEKIERFSKGIFEYQQPEIELSQEVIELFVNEGAVEKGSFIISNQAGTSMKGVIYSTSKLITVENNTFVGVKSEIFYTVDCSYMEQGSRCEALINIVSDCGERQIPVMISVVGITCSSPVGHVGNVFQFANLARTNWNSAVSLFGTKEFYEAVIKKDDSVKVAYNVLKKCPDQGLAVEEFLCICKKKTECRFFVGTSEINLECDNESFVEKILISKSTWGCLSLKVTTDADFLKPVKENIDNDEFINSRFELKLLVDLTKAGEGVHIGNVIISNAKHSVKIPVSIRVRSKDDTRKLRLRNIKNYERRIIDRYLSFRAGKQAGATFIAESVKLTESALMVIDKELAVSKHDNTYLSELKEAYEIYRAYLATVEGRHFRNDELVGNILLRRTEYERKHSRYFPVILYIEALRARNKELTDANLQTIRHYYEANPEDTLLFWIMLYMDKHLEENADFRYEKLIRQFSMGNNSPIITYEAAALVKEKPELLTSGDINECRIVTFMLKYDMITADVAIQFAYCCRKAAENDRRRLGILLKLYELFDDDGILEMLCKKLISLDERRAMYHPIFKKACENQIKADGIYEYFIYTMNGDLSEEIPQNALLYFGYTKDLDEKSQELLYAYVIRNKETNKAIYRAYLKNMEQLAVNCLKERRINPLLSAIYADVVGRSLLDSDTIDTFPDVLFTYSVTCESPEMTGVVVVNREEKDEKYYELVNGHADVLMYTESCDCFLVDANGNRYVYTGCGHVSRYLHMQDMLATCYDLGSGNPRLLLYMWERNSQYNAGVESYITLQKQISVIPGLSDEIQNNCSFSLAEYYFDNYEGELLESYLKSIDLTGIDSVKRTKTIELMILRDMYEEVIDAVGKFGCEGLSPKRLSRLCMFGIEKNKDATDKENIVAMAHYAFRNGQVDERLVQYLANNFTGTTLEMYEIWNSAKEYELDTMVIEENLLAQMLFAESYIENAYSVFLDYYYKSQNRKLIRAFISYTAYKYFVRDRVTNPDFFKILEMDPSLENSQIGILALLKFYSTKDSLTASEKEFSDSHIRHFLQKKIFYSFFKDFKDKITLPSSMVDKCYIEYRTDPKKQVFVHYTYNDNLDISVEQLTDMGYGIFTKEIILFHDEVLQYFITEHDGENEEITESRSVRYLDEDVHERETKYDEINGILIAVEMQDEKTTIDLLEQYFRTEYAMKRHFKPL